MRWGAQFPRVGQVGQRLVARAADMRLRRRAALYGILGMAIVISGLQRSIRLIFGLYMTWVLVAFLPGHTRGAITLDGAAPAVRKASCCSGGDAPAPAPDERQRRACAVCYIAKAIVHATPASLELAPLHRTAAPRTLGAARPHSADARRGAGCRDPPLPA